MPSENIVKKVTFKLRSKTFLPFVKIPQAIRLFYLCESFDFLEKRDSSKINPVHWTPPLDDADEPPESRLVRGRPIKVLNLS